MKSNREIADSVFEKSKVVIQKRAKRRKAITAAGSTLGLIAVVTAAVIISKNTPSGRVTIPTQSAPDIESSSSSLISAPDESSSVFRISVSSAAETSSTESTSHEKEKDNNTNTSDSSSNKSSAPALSRSSSSTGSNKNEQRISTTHTTQNDGDISHDNSSKTTSSKTTSSRTTSSRTTSSRTTSSNTVSSENDKTPAKPSMPSSLPTESSFPDSENEMATDIDQNEGNPGSEEAPIPNSPDPPTTEPSTDAETDSEALAGGDFYDVYYYNEAPYTSADQLAAVSDKMVVGVVQNVDYVTLEEQYKFLLDNIIKPDVPQDSSEPDFGDLIAIYTIEIQEDLTARGDDSRGDTILLYVYGGSQYGDYSAQEWAAGGSSKIPIVENMKRLDIGGNYIFALKNHGDIITLVNYDQSIYNADDHYDNDYSGQITTEDIYAGLR